MIELKNDELKYHIGIMDAKLDRLNYLISLMVENKAKCNHPLIEDYDEKLYMTITSTTGKDGIKTYNYKYVKCVDCGILLTVEV